ncbi:MAG: LPXTG cell wall anchor domain-containing protein [Acidimicrobiia bacterium]
MTSSVRKLISMTALALVASAALAGVASAGSMPGVPPTSPGTCTFELSGTGVGPDGTVTSLPADVIVSGAVPAGATVVQLFVAQPFGTPLVLNQSVAPVGNAYSFAPVHITVEADLSVSYLYGNENAYTTTCSGPGGLTVVRIRPAGAQAARPLAFTGSNDTMQYVLIGIAALAIGSVLVVGARRRNRVHV